MTQCGLLRSASIIALAMAVVILPGAAMANPHLATARQALDELDYEKALQSLEQALIWGKNRPAQVVEIYRLRGEVHAALGHGKDAEAEFQRLLSMDPGASLPAGSSPKLTQPFGAAQAHVRTHGALRVRCELDRQGPAVRVHVDADPLRLVTGARAVFRTGTDSTQSIEARGQGTVTLTLPAARDIELFCAAIDEHGNHVAEVGSLDEPLSLSLAQPAAGDQDKSDGPETPRQSLVARWPVWGVLTVAAVGGGTYFALQTRSARDELERLNQDSGNYDFSVALDVQRRGERNALLTNISFGVAGACALVTAIMFVRRPAASPATRSASVIPVVLHQGAAISVAGSF